MKAQRGSRGIATLTLNVDARWKRVVNITLRLIYFIAMTAVPSAV